MKENKGEQPDWKVKFQNWYLNPKQDWQKDAANPKYVPYMYIEKFIEEYIIPAAQPSKVQEKDRYWVDQYILRGEKIIELEQEIQRLKAWKESAISVMPDMQAIGKALNVPLGQSVHDKILPGIERLKGIIEDRERIINQYADKVNELNK